MFVGCQVDDGADAQGIDLAQRGDGVQDPITDAFMDIFGVRKLWSGRRQRVHVR